MSQVGGHHGIAFFPPTEAGANGKRKRAEQPATETGPPQMDSHCAALDAYCDGMQDAARAMRIFKGLSASHNRHGDLLLAKCIARRLMANIEALIDAHEILPVSGQEEGKEI